MSGATTPFCAGRYKTHRRCIGLLLLFTAVFAFFAEPVKAHFKLNLNIRVFHVEHVEDGLNILLRVPMPYLVADQLGPPQADGTPEPAPFTFNRMVDGELLHYVDFDALAKNPLPLGELASVGHVLHTDNRTLTAVVTDVRVYEGQQQPPFSTLEEARRAFADDQPLPKDNAPFVGDSVVDVRLEYRGAGRIEEYQLSSSLNPNLPGQEDTANLILDYATGTQKVFRATGLLTEPVTVSHSSMAAATTFIIEGVRHILGGPDHVLFVVCLILASLTLVTLAVRITGFTIGHSITLALGFFGYVPAGAWFIPMVETGIALSIIYAAVVAIAYGAQPVKAQTTTFWVTVAIGMLHGLGFSFVLQEILGISAGNVWVNLLSFNIGVELGQLLIVLLLWPLLMLILKYRPGLMPTITWIIALPCIAIASVWAGQRAVALLGVLVGNL